MNFYILHLSSYININNLLSLCKGPDINIYTIIHACDVPNKFIIAASKLKGNYDYRNVYPSCKFISKN